MCTRKYILDIEGDYSDQVWFNDVQEYIRMRYEAIEDRYVKTFNFVTPDKENRYTYSYEYASILRDIGSGFDSAFKMIINKAKLDFTDDIHGILKFLRSYEPYLEYIGLEFLNTQKNLYPFKPSPNGLPFWWHAYNKVKHSEIENKMEGNFENTTNALAALLIIKRNITSLGRGTSIFTIINIPSIHGGKEYRFKFFND